jgi:hypothetical protein
MSSSDDGEPQVPMMTVVHARSGADFEAGRGGRPRGEHIKAQRPSIINAWMIIEPEDEAAEAETAAKRRRSPHGGG